MTLPTATPLPTALRDAALRWIADDPSPADRAELQRIVADAMGGRPGATEELDATGWPVRSASAPPGCAVRCAPGRPG